ncbi:MAG: XynC protein [Leeuwenhoekiella sp.]|nr:XynC protein [Leeuwenhoekiella sp.]
MRSLHQLVLGLFLFTCTLTYAGKLETVTTHSDVMDKDIKAMVITPDDYDTSKKYPVVYLLHGHSGSYIEWPKRAPQLLEFADTYQMIFVSPDGNYNSWYFDSEVKPESQYETYIAEELVAFTDNTYSTIKDRIGRAITGLSMGGHGALYLAFKHQDVFGAAGSMSGGVDITPFPNNWELSEYLGTYAENTERWEANSVINMTPLLTPNSLQIMISCGASDFFYDANVKLHEKLEYMNIPHRFLTTPGGHTWDVWRDAIKYHLVFFDSFFNTVE